MKYLFLLFISLFAYGYALAYQNNSDSIQIASNETDSEDISRHLDSLLNVWYVQNMTSNDVDSLINVNEDEIPVFSDSIVIDRLNKLPMIIDMTYNDQVKSFIKLYTVKRRRQVKAMMGLSDYYFPKFEEILDAYDLPLELKYLPIIESALNPRAVSRAGATGIWQFMYTTGKLYKLKINTFVDERRDPIKSTHAAAQFLKDLYGIYGDWTLALAAYNCGPGNVNKAIRRSNGSTDFWEIYYKLPRETRGYVPAFIAAAYAMEYHKEYNIVSDRIDYPLLTDTIKITENLHLGQVAEVLNIDLRLIQDLNPQYRRDIVPGESDTYALLLPMKYATQFIEFQDSIFNYKDSVFFNKSEGVVKAPPVYSAESYVPDPPSENMEAVSYTIKSGDNLGFIASWFSVNVNDLRYWNNISRNLIRAGQKMVIYVDKKTVEKYKKVDSMSFEQKQKMIGKTVTKSETTTEESKETVISKTKDDGKGKYQWYTVKSGDNFWTIAKKYNGVSNTDIMQLNGINDPGSLKPGQKLKIKRLN